MLNRRLNVNVSKSWGRNSTLHQHTHGHGDAESASAHWVGEGLGQDGDDPHPVDSCPLAATEGFPSPRTPHGMERDQDAVAATGCQGDAPTMVGDPGEPCALIPMQGPCGDHPV